MRRVFQSAGTEIGRNIRLTAAVTKDHALLVLSDGTREYRTPVVPVEKIERGQVGVWLFQIGERQEYDNFAISRTPLVKPADTPDPRNHLIVQGGDFEAPPVPSPQDWLLVLERVKPQ
jgi:hypothetical protein